uniref:Uncharacterized protein n=1 Tax=Citrifermentans bremense TaxID=60035 RepID=A0A6S6M2I2_9BACT
MGGMEPDHVEAADQANVLFAIHKGLRYRKKATGVIIAPGMERATGLNKAWPVSA